MSVRTVIVGDELPLDSRRLDTFVAGLFPRLPRRLVRRVLAAGDVRVNGRPAPKGLRLQPGDRVTLPELPDAIAPEPALGLAVVHEDPALVVLDKPGGMPGHALDPRQHGTAAAFVVARWPETALVGDALAPGLVHRLDTGTSGLLVAARTVEAFGVLRAAFRAGQVEKGYLAVVAGDHFAQPTCHVATPLAHDPRDRRRMIPAPPGARAWPAETHVALLAARDGRALVAATIRTGVTHQVRVHLALLGHPVVNDRLYGGPATDALPSGRHALHAARLALPHPADGRVLRLSRELPPELVAFAPSPPA